MTLQETVIIRIMSFSVKPCMQYGSTPSSTSSSMNLLGFDLAFDVSALHCTGTTTATVLTRAILSEGCKSVAAGMNPMDLRRGINLAVDHILADLKKRAKMISTTEEIAQVTWPSLVVCSQLYLLSQQCCKPQPACTIIPWYCPVPFCRQHVGFAGLQAHRTCAFQTQTWAVS